jgi:hypothetical protein
LDRIAGFFRINRIGVNHDHPEKSCNPVKNNGSFLIATKRHKRHKRGCFYFVRFVHFCGYFVGRFY